MSELTEQQADVFLRLLGLPPYGLDAVVESMEALDGVRSYIEQIKAELEERE